MWEAAGTVEHALGDLAGSVTGASPLWLALGIVLHLLNQVARGCGWYAVVRSACGEEDPGLQRRDTIAAWIAGAAAGGLLSSRGGDAVRAFVLSRRLPKQGCALVAGTLVAEGAGELLIGVGLAVLAIGLGVGPQVSMPGPVTVLAVAAGVAALAVAVRRFGPLRRAVTRAAQGCTSLRTPGAYARGVLPWQLTSRACRLGALACLLIAFGLPATPIAILLVAFAQTSGRIVPFGPASVGAGVALLAATFEPATGTAVPASDLALFFVGTSTVLTLVGAALAVGICVRTARLRRLAHARPA